MLTLFFATLFSSVGVFAQVSTYLVSTSTSTFTPITGGTVIYGLGVAYDDNISGSQTINSFTFNGTAYTTMAINSNGWLSLGVSTTGGSYTPLSGTQTGGSAIIAPFGRDQQSQATSEIRWQYLAASNETVIQWLGARSYAGIGVEFNYQARLNHTNNTIQFVYGNMVVGNNTGNIQVGIKNGVSAGVIGTTMNSTPVPR